MATLEQLSEFVELVMNCSDESIEKAISMVSLFDAKLVEDFINFIASIKELCFEKIGKVFFENMKRKGSKADFFMNSRFEKYISLKYPDYCNNVRKVTLRPNETIEWYENPIANNEIAQLIMKDDVNDFVSYITDQNIDVSKYQIDLIDLHFHIDQFASVCGALNIFKYLYINKTSAYEIAQTAVLGGNEGIIDFLVDKDVSFNETLIIALWNHQNKVAKWIFENYQNIGFSLPVCVFYYNYEMLFYLLANGIDINTQDSAKKTCLHYAIHQSNLLAVKYLLDHGIDKNIEDSSHCKAIAYCENDTIHKLLE